MRQDLGAGFIATHVVSIPNRERDLLRLKGKLEGVGFLRVSIPNRERDLLRR